MLSFFKGRIDPKFITIQWEKSAVHIYYELLLNPPCGFSERPLLGSRDIAVREHDDVIEATPDLTSILEAAYRSVTAKDCRGWIRRGIW